MKTKTIHFKITQKMKILRILTVTLGLISCSSLLQAQVLYVNYNFNAGSGATFANSGTVGGNGTFNTASSTTPTYSANAGGVSGLSGDYALDNTSVASMNGSGGYGRQSSMNLAASLTSFTLAGWYYAPTAGVANTTLLGQVSTGVIPQIRFSSASTLEAVNAGTTVIRGITTSGASVIQQTNAWVFFAATYDGTAALVADRLKFYIGDTTTAVTQLTLGTYTATATSSVANGMWLDIAGKNGGNTFDGLMDDIAIYGATTGSAGALSSSTLESLRIAAVPEPTTWALLATALAVVVTLRRRRVS